MHEYMEFGLTYYVLEIYLCIFFHMLDVSPD